jgi:hypothetical protein
MLLANGQLRAFRLLGMLQFSDSRGDCPADCMRSIDPGVVNFEFGVEGNAARGVFVKLQIDFELDQEIGEAPRPEPFTVEDVPI